MAETLYICPVRKHRRCMVQDVCLTDSLFDGMIGDSSGSDIPLSMVVSRSCGPGKRTLAVEKPPISRKDKGKARADAFVSADVGASGEVPRGE